MSAPTTPAPAPVERPPATLPLPNALAYLIAAVAVTAAAILPFALVAGGIPLADAVNDFDLHSAVGAAAAALGALILLRRPGHVIGWVLVGSGAFATPVNLAVEYRSFGLGELPGLPPSTVVTELVNWCVVPAIASLFMALPQLFPDGRLLSRRCRPLAWFAIAAATLTAILWAIEPLAILFAFDPDAPETAWLFEWLFLVAFPAFGLAVLGSMVPLVLRFRRSRGAERQQFKWVFYGLAVSIPTAAMWTVAPLDVGLRAALLLLGLVIIPATITVAVLRYRLYDIDLVINKTVVFVALAGFITAVYAAVVVGVGRLFPVGENNLALSIAATAVVAVVFEPVRDRVQRWANRLVYGARATPYEALAAMTAHIAEAADPDATLGEAARLLAEGTGAARAVVWVAQNGRLHPRGRAGDGVGELGPVAVRGVELPELPGSDLVQVVRHDGQLVGALSVTKRAGEGVSTADRKLVWELAGQATLLLANTRLRSRLGERVEALRVSRRRMLAAQDRARHGLERDLHDGAQQELVALKIKLGLARTIATREGAPDLAERLGHSAALADQAVDTLREVARGIYPPLLDSEGLPAALGALARRAGITATVRDAGVGRYPREIETTAYFCVTEALANAEHHAHARNARIGLAGTADTLTVTVIDDGTGFDPDSTARGTGLTHMTDRADAAGGTLALTSRPGHGTTITLTLPAGAQRAAAIGPVR